MRASLFCPSQYNGSSKKKNVHILTIEKVRDYQLSLFLW